MKKLWFISIPVVILVLFFQVSCKKKDTDPPEETPIVQHRVFILNEGTFQQGNASLSIYDKDNQGVYNDVYQQKNGTGFGDILQSLLIKDGKGYFAVNNSNKIIVADLVDYHKVGEVASVSSPRYILPVSSTKAFVSSLWDHNLAILDFSSLTLTGYIAMPGWTEQMILVGNTAYVTSVSSSALYLVNTATNQVTDSIVVGKAPKNILKDKNGKLWVLCGEYDSGEGHLVRVNPQDNTVEQNIVLPLDVNNVPAKLSINGTGDTLYYLYKGVQRLAITDSVPESFLPESEFNAAYGLGVDPATSQVYVTDAMDFTQKGFLLRFSPAGNKLDEIQVGYVPAAVYFE